MKHLLSAALCCLLFTACYTNPETPEGHEGYVREQPRIWGNGGFQGKLVGPENFGFSFWNNTAINIDFRPQTYSEEFRILSSDELNIAFRFQAIIKPKPNTIQEVVEQYGGEHFYARYIKEPLRSFVRNRVQVLESRDVKNERELIAQDVKQRLDEYLADSPFVVLAAVVGNIDYPEVVTKAVEKKLAAKQLLDEKDTQREIAQKDAEIRIEEARGIAKSQEIINRTLTENYLQHEAINAQLKMASSPNHTTVYIPSGTNGIPLVRTIK